MGVNLDLKADATQAITNTSENLPKGFGKIWNALCGKHDADVQRYKMLTAVQTQKECELVFSGKADFIDGELVESAQQGNITAQILVNEQQQEMQNLAGNVAVALEELKNTPDEEISDGEVDHDWFARWRREAKVIGNPELQVLWGKILAEEVREPDKISFRALDVIKNLTRKEAEIFCEVCRYTVSGANLLSAYYSGKFVPEYEAIKNLLILEECQLIGSPNSNLSASPSAGVGSALVVNGVLVTPKDLTKTIMTGIIPLTPVGTALYGIIDRKEFPEDKLSKLEDGVFYSKEARGQKLEVNIRRFTDIFTIG